MLRKTGYTTILRQYPKSTLALGMALWSLFAFLYLLSARGSWYAGDDMFYLIIARNWLLYGSPQYGFSLTDLEMSKYAIGQVILQLPIAMAVDRMLDPTATWNQFLAAMLVIGAWQSALGALQVVLLWRIVIHLGCSTRVALITALCYGAGTMIWPGTQRAYADQMMALFFLLIVWGVYRSRLNGRGGFAIAAAASAYLILLKPTAIVFSAIFFVFLLHHAWRAPRKVANLLTLGTTYVLIGCAAAWYNVYRYGSIFEMGYGSDFEGGFGFNTPVMAGVYNLLLSSGKGVFWYNPVLLLLFAGLVPFVRERRADAWLLLALVLATLLLYGRFWAWHGDWYWGPRYLVPLLPLLMIPAAYAIARMRSRLAISLLVSLFALSVAVQILGVLCVSNEYFVIMERKVVPVVFNEANFYGDDVMVTDPHLLMHNVPSFSPLRVHAWMLNLLIHERGDWHAIYQNPPWLHLNLNWTLPVAKEFPLTFQPWWLFMMTKNLPSGNWAYLLCFFSAIGFVVSACLLARSLYFHKPPTES